MTMPYERPDLDRIVEDPNILIGKPTVKSTRTWCPTGTAQRQRKAGVVTVTDPKTEEKRG
ncbi:MAG: hypothetical protein ACYDCQ_00440 [Dehalococcoidia bacterium]